MTRDELLATLYPWRDRLRRWAPIVACIVLALLLVRSCQARRTAEAAATAAHARAAGEQQAQAAGIPVVQQVDQQAVDARVAALERYNDQLKAERDRAHRELGDLRSILAAHAETKPIPIACAAAPRDPERPVALYMGEPLKLGADLIVDEIKGGAHIMSGTLDASGPRGLLARQPFLAPVTVTAQVAPPPPPPRSLWRWGPQGGYSASGWLAGATAMTPEVRLPLLGLRVGWSASVAAGPGGVFAFTGPTF
jgi:hypothetical protein